MGAEGSSSILKSLEPQTAAFQGASPRTSTGAISLFVMYCAICIHCAHPHTHTHTYIYKSYIYMLYIYICICIEREGEREREIQKHNRLKFAQSDLSVRLELSDATP